MRVLKESKYTYLEAQAKRNGNLGFIFLGVSIPAFILAYMGGWLIGIPLLVVSLKYFRNSFSFRSGIRGEKAVVDTLGVLDDSYCMINDIMLGDTGGNIDHVLVGRNGVFAIETKNYTGSVRCSGDYWSKRGARRWYDIRSISKQATINAVRLKRLISRQTAWEGFVEAICVFTDPSVVLQLKRPTLTVLRVWNVADFIREARPSQGLSDSQVDVISNCILAECAKHPN